MRDTLEFSRDKLERWGELVQEFIVDYLDDLERFSAGPTGFSVEEIRRELIEPLPAHPQKPQEVWHDFLHQVAGNSVRVGHPLFLAWIRSSPLAAAVFAEALAGALNQSVAVWDGAPAATEVEKLVIDWLIELTGYDPQGAGILTSGGSMANFSGLLAARSVALPGVRDRGLRAFPPAAVYLTPQTHYSVHKALQMMGLGRDAVRVIPVRQDLGMDTRVLARRIQEDRSDGVQPMAVVATVGTTSTGASDDLRSIQAVCQSQEVWLHVDGAYGGAASLVPEKQEVLQGLDRADSFVFDPHKNLFMPFEVGCLMVRDAGHLRAAFEVAASYLPNTEDGGRETEDPPRFHFRDYGPQLSRSFRALKIYLSLKLYGVTAIAREIQREYELAASFGRMIEEAPDFEFLAEVHLGIVAFRYVPEEPPDPQGLDKLQERVLAEVQRRGTVFLSRVEVQGNVGFRACFVSHRTRRSHLGEVLQELRRAAKAVEKGGGVW